MKMRKPPINLAECIRLIGEQRYQAALYSFEEVLDRLIEARKSTRGGDVARELKKLIVPLEDSFKNPHASERSSFPGPAAQVLTCSFCGKSQDEVRKLIAGPTVYICNECIDLCNDIIAEEGNLETEAQAASAAESGNGPSEQNCAFCSNPRDEKELIHIAAGMRFCTSCLEAIHTVTEKREDKK